MKTAMESVTHDPEMYVQHHEGLVRWMECVLRAAGINQAHVKLSAQEAHVPSLYHSSTAILVVMPDPAVPEFPGEMVSSTSFNLAAAIQSVARKMIKRIVARFWNAKFKESSFRLIPRAISVMEDRWAAIAAMAAAPNQERGRDPHLMHYTGSYLFDVDNLMVDLEIENSHLHLWQDANARHILDLEAEVKGWSIAYTKANEAALRANQEIHSTRMMLQEEIARRAEVEEKLADAQGDLEIADYQLVLLQDGEKENLDNINKLEKRE